MAMRIRQVQKGRTDETEIPLTSNYGTIFCSHHPDGVPVPEGMKFSLSDETCHKNRKVHVTDQFGNEYKHCGRCGRWKMATLFFFYSSTNRWDKLDYYCKECRDDYPRRTGND